VTTPDPFAGMFDGDVLEWAVAHLRRAADFPLGSHLSKREWLKLSAAMAELDRRQMLVRGRAALRLVPMSVTWHGPQGG
jgi:hypothetical protein